MTRFDILFVCVISNLSLSLSLSLHVYMDMDTHTHTHTHIHIGGYSGIEYVHQVHTSSRERPCISVCLTSFHFTTRGGRVLPGRSSAKPPYHACLSQRQRNLELTRYFLQGHQARTTRVTVRSMRNTRALESSFVHLCASVHPCAKSVGLPTLHVRLNMWDWSWNTRALQVSGDIPNVGHP